MTAFEIFELGDHALVATAVDAVSFETQQRIWQIAELARTWPEVDEAIPGMNNVTLIFDPLATDLESLRAALEGACHPFGDEAAAPDPVELAVQLDAVTDGAAHALARDTSTPAGTRGNHSNASRQAQVANAAEPSATPASRATHRFPAFGRVIELPVQYGGAEGPDIEAVARHAGLSVASLIERHAATEYTVYFLGFQPGFAYLGGLDPALATPRRKEPRVRVPAGSVGIGGEQTGVYPMSSPGGWQLIGRTSTVLFDPDRDPPSLLEPGDRVRFVPVGGAQ